MNSATSPAGPAPALGEGDALLLVDVQADFCPGGALPVEAGDTVVPVLNAWIEAASRAGVPVIASRDLHPGGHMSFTESGGPWPVHCVQDTPGAAFHGALQLPSGTIYVAKGTRLDRDQYSAFDETGLAPALRARGVRRLWVGGLALDVCVRATVLDALREGFEVRLIRDGSRPVEAAAGARALAEMKAAGAHVV
ncbi:isochorismatase family protein [Falsiroseomonas sp.]|uniref:isochorismatase family protein n=1 Tax=Falsiroseomonas sp. TaxID=2870721 RepID=UPI003564A428